MSLHELELELDDLALAFTDGVHAILERYGMAEDYGGAVVQLSFLPSADDDTGRVEGRSRW